MVCEKNSVMKLFSPHVESWLLEISAWKKKILMWGNGAISASDGESSYDFFNIPTWNASLCSSPDTLQWGILVSVDVMNLKIFSNFTDFSNSDTGQLILHNFRKCNCSRIGHFIFYCSVMVITRYSLGSNKHAGLLKSAI